MRQSLQDVVDDAQTPVAKGGRMRVDTGFLRASGMASLNGMPNGPSTNPGNGSFAWNDNQLALVLGQMKLGATFHFGWTANYAKYREAYDGFLAVAAQKWPQIVEKNAREIMKRIKS